MSLYPLYIDPGTGSMLFSVLIGAAATLYFFLRTVIIKAKVFFAGGRKASISTTTTYVIYCEGAHYWNVFKPILDEFEKRQQEIIYLTSAKDDPVFKAAYTSIKPEYIGEGNKAFSRLNMISAQVLLMTTPALDVYQMKRSKGVKHYAHILHAPSDATMYRLFGIDYFDSVLLSGEYQKKDIRILEEQRGLPEKRLVVVGCPYLDVYAEKIKTLPAESAPDFTVLVSPSWGPSALLARWGERLLDPLAKTGWRIIVRPHPQSKKSEQAMLETLARKYAETSTIVWDYERENIHSLSKANVMISDFSGIVFDYAFLCDKPVFYATGQLDLRPYDAYDVCTDERGTSDLMKLWQFRALADFGIELKEEMLDNIAALIQNAADSAALRAARNRAKDEAWMYRSEAGKRTVDFMITQAAAPAA